MLVLSAAEGLQISVVPLTGVQFSMALLGCSLVLALVVIVLDV